jgi:hypothetical protein
MLKTTVYLDEAAASKLKRMADAQGRSQAELIRKGVAQLIESHPPKLPNGMGKFSSTAGGTISATYRTRLRAAVRAGKWK